jgi:hypothetical protein
MWLSRTKSDLIIEVWEKLDCESVGAAEIEAIEEAVRGRFGNSAVESPMIIARLLADEGAELRHAEIMQLYVERNVDDLYDVLVRNILKLSDLKNAVTTLRDLENARKKFASERDKEGLRILRSTALQGKKDAAAKANDSKLEARERAQSAEIAQWLTLWLQSPELFESWVELRKNSAEFKERFGDPQ